MSWRDHILSPDTVMIPLPLTGPNPTLTCRTVTWVARTTKTCTIERLLFAKQGNGRITAKIWVESNLQTPEPFDAEMIGSPSAFGTRLYFPTIDAGITLRAELTWHPGAWLCRMSAKEYQRRKRTDNWAISWFGQRLRIEADKAKKHRVTNRREPKLSIPDFHQVAIVSCSLLVSVAK
jgi:hypothetical protein